jgi:hypothetical protein
MGTWRIKKVNSNLKGFKRPGKGTLKQGDIYYWCDLISRKITDQLVYDPEARKPIDSYYTREIDMQIEWGYIYIKE